MTEEQVEALAWHMYCRTADTYDPAPGMVHELWLDEGVHEFWVGEARSVLEFLARQAVAA